MIFCTAIDRFLIETSENPVVRCLASILDPKIDDSSRTKDRFVNDELELYVLISIEAKVSRL